MDKLIVSLRQGVRLIKFHDPKTRNALNKDIYNYIKHTLNADSKNNDVVVTIFTGSGGFYSSGNNFKIENFEDISKQANFEPFRDMVEAFINYPKLLICVVNGAAYGIAATMVALCDIAYASDKATFHTPFLNLGICMEGCSSYLLPRILGKSKASEMLFLNEKLTAQEAYNSGFVSRLIPHDKIDDFIESLYKFGKLPVENLIRNKALVSSYYRNTLLETNQREKNALEDCVNSEEFLTTFMNYAAKKRSKL